MAVHEEWKGQLGLLYLNLLSGNSACKRAPAEGTGALKVPHKALELALLRPGPLRGSGVPHWPYSAFFAEFPHTTWDISTLVVLTSLLRELLSRKGPQRAGSILDAVWRKHLHPPWSSLIKGQCEMQSASGRFYLQLSSWLPPHHPS